MFEVKTPFSKGEVGQVLTQEDLANRGIDYNEAQRLVRDGVLVVKGDPAAVGMLRNDSPDAEQLKEEIARQQERVNELEGQIQNMKAAGQFATSDELRKATDQAEAMRQQLGQMERERNEARQAADEAGKELAALRSNLESVKQELEQAKAQPGAKKGR